MTAEWVTVASFTVHGEPIPKARPRAKAGQRPFTPKKVVIAERNVLAAFRLAYPDWETLPGESRLRLDVVFHRATRRRVDVDNLVKVVTDALNQHAFVDDEQIEELHARRVYGAGDQARTVVRLSESTH